ncbi:hypothetical protein SDC9_179452 [bioreactor metagenome]|uniref:Uncharacterized protein n=1 Tax=bioreactor metagenome TaxID=1076179 RepID=A0A645GYZ2_9ZZZZ
MLNADVLAFSNHRNRAAKVDQRARNAALDQNPPHLVRRISFCDGAEVNALPEYAKLRRLRFFVQQNILVVDQQQRVLHLRAGRDRSAAGVDFPERAERARGNGKRLFAQRGKALALAQEKEGILADGYAAAPRGGI